MKRAYNATSTCPATVGSYPNSTTTWTETTQTNNGKYVCIFVADVAGNTATLASANPINIDATVPTVTNVTATNADTDYKAGSNIDVTVVFSEPVYVT